MKKIKIVHEQATGNRANLKTLIDQIMSGPNPHPKDSSFRLTVSGWAKPSHGTFDFQGKYLKKLDTNVVTEDGRNLEMDHGIVVLPDGGIIKVKSELISNTRLGFLMIQKSKQYSHIRYLRLMRQIFQQHPS